MAWHMDSAIFGNPDFGFGQTHEQQFVCGVGDLGRGQYRDYNPTAALPVSVVWGMNGDQLQAFREAWEARTALAWGASWFTLDLPMGLTEQGGGVGPYEPTPIFLNVTIEVYAPANRKGFADGRFDGQEPHGEIAPRKIDGRWIRECFYNTSGFGFRFSLEDDLPWAQNPILLPMSFPQTGESTTASFSGGDYRISDLPTLCPEIGAYLNAAQDGDTLEVVVTPDLQLWQRVRCHFVNPFQANMAGYDYWKVSAQLEVDVSPDTTWAAALPAEPRSA